MDKISNALTDYYIKKNHIQECNRDIYVYGFKLIVADIINFSIILLLGFILNKFIESILFLITLCGLRQFSGGFHAKTFWLCRLSMIITFLCVIGLVTVITALPLILPIIIVIDSLCVIIIAIFAPIEHPNKKLTLRQRKSNKIKSIITSFVLSVIAIILTAIVDITNGVTISLTLVAVVFLMLISLLMGKGGVENV